MRKTITSPRIRMMFVILLCWPAACVPTDIQEGTTATVVRTAMVTAVSVTAPLPTTTPTPIQSEPTPLSTATLTTVLSLPMPTPTIAPTPTELPPLAASGPFQPSLSLAPEIFGSVAGLRTLDDGSVMLTTTSGYALLRDGEWHTQPVGQAKILVGVDDMQRMWYFVEDDPDQIYAWDGGPDVILADDGWQPVANPSRLRGHGVLTDSDGGVWLATAGDIRRFDGERWTIFTLDDLTMLPPPDMDMYTLFTLESMDSTGQVWVGECHWGGPGPFGGGGVRWFDGSAWHGADSPVADGCATAVQEDSLGRVWASLDADLWRYDPATAAWERFGPPPPPPDAVRFGFINHLAIDPDGNPWVSYALCGGASCGGRDLRFHWQDGAWVQIGASEAVIAPILLFDEIGMYLLFDGMGIPWLFTDFQISRIVDNQLLPVTDLIVNAAVTDDDGRIWVAGTDQTTGVWVFDPAEETETATAVCPRSNLIDLPTITADAPGSSVADMFEPQIRAYLNAGGNLPELATQLLSLTPDIGGGTIWRSQVEMHITADVTGDGIEEVILSLVFYEPHQYFNGEMLVFRCRDGEYEGGSIAGLAGGVVGEQPDTTLLAVLDMNGNGRAEIVFTTVAVVGTHANFTREVRIMEWDGVQFVDLIHSDGSNPHAAEVLNAPSPSGIMIEDVNGDGLLELKLTNGVGHGPDADENARPFIDVWAWDGIAFVLIDSQGVASP